MERIKMQNLMKVIIFSQIHCKSALIDDYAFTYLQFGAFCDNKPSKYLKKWKFV